MQLAVKFLGAEPNEQTPNIAAYSVDARGQATKIASLKDGKLDLGPESKLGATVTLGPDVADTKTLDPKLLVTLRVADQLPFWKKTQSIDIPTLWWRPWWPITICLSGKVNKCYPFIIDRVPLLRSIAVGIGPIVWERCWPVCNGVVEVWESTCCCFPFLPLYVPPFLEKLEAFLAANPVMFPAVPQPGAKTRRVNRALAKSVDRAIAGGKVDLRFTPNTELAQDLEAMKGMSAQDAAQYFQLRPELWPIWCHCSQTKLGETALNPDGTFAFCYEQYLFPIPICFRSYFYKVKQMQSGVWVYIYDGAAANQYFNADQIANLSTFLGNACGNVPPPPGTDFVTLQQIGSTPAYNLHSNYMGVDGANNDLTQTGAYTVAAPIPASGGLVNSNDAPWCKTLYFMLYFDPGMEALGAYYYRMSYAPADTNGNPVGPTQILTNPIAWSKFVTVIVGGLPQIDIVPQALGPNTVGTLTGLYQIPYNADADWLSAQFHQYFDTTTLNPTASGVPGPGNGRFLLVVETFDNAGNRLVPAGVGLQPGDKSTPFQFIRLMSASGPGSTANVPQAALTHLFWADNRPVVGEIDSFTLDGITSSEECQFLSGPSSAEFQVGYRAYHAVLSDPDPPNPLPPASFMSNFELWWERGLSGPTGVFDSGGDTDMPSTRASGPPQESPAANGSLSTLFAPPPTPPPTSCSFAIQLDVYSKHTDGSSHFSDLDAEALAAVALSVT
ncbi:MAG TPA: hypothetical protein VN950_10715 [Terriglobales bacterium]|nr:hypothetical protein [Terriglobales bacterium]